MEQGWVARWAIIIGVIISIPVFLIMGGSFLLAIIVLPLLPFFLPLFVLFPAELHDFVLADERDLRSSFNCSINFYYLNPLKPSVTLSALVNASSPFTLARTYCSALMHLDTSTNSTSSEWNALVATAYKNHTSQWLIFILVILVTALLFLRGWPLGESRWRLLVFKANCIVSILFSFLAIILYWSLRQPAISKDVLYAAFFHESGLIMVSHHQRRSLWNAFFLVPAFSLPSQPILLLCFLYESNGALSAQSQRVFEDYYRTLVTWRQHISRIARSIMWPLHVCAFAVVLLLSIDPIFWPSGFMPEQLWSESCRNCPHEPGWAVACMVFLTFGTIVPMVLYHFLWVHGRRWWHPLSFRGLREGTSGCSREDYRPENQDCNKIHWRAAALQSVQWIAPCWLIVGEIALAPLALSSWHPSCKVSSDALHDICITASNALLARWRHHCAISLLILLVLQGLHVLVWCLEYKFPRPRDPDYRLKSDPEGDQGPLGVASPQQQTPVSQN